MTESDRRVEIMEAVGRLLSRSGVNAVTMRAVAAEAGVSLRLVQYYGNTKAELLTATLHHHAQKSVERWRARIEGENCTSPAGVVEVFLDAALPTDEASRDFHRFGVAMEAIAISNPELAGSAYNKHLDALADLLAGMLTSDDVSPGVARLLALEVMALAHGVGTLMMTGQLSELDARALSDAFLARLGPQLTTAPHEPS